jgi:hypothetical protein
VEEWTNGVDMGVVDEVYKTPLPAFSSFIINIAKKLETKTYRRQYPCGVALAWTKSSPQQRDVLCAKRIHPNHIYDERYSLQLVTFPEKRYRSPMEWAGAKPYTLQFPYQNA